MKLVSLLFIALLLSGCAALGSSTMRKPTDTPHRVGCPHPNTHLGGEKPPPYFFELHPYEIEGWFPFCSNRPLKADGFRFKKDVIY